MKAGFAIRELCGSDFLLLFRCFIGIVIEAGLHLGQGTATVTNRSVGRNRLSQARRSQDVGGRVGSGVGGHRCRGGVQRATALEHGSGGRSFGRNRSRFACRCRRSLGTRAAVGTVAARAITFGAGATVRAVATVVARAAIAFGTGATVGTVAARAAITFGTGAAVATVVTRAAIAFGAGATVGTVATRAAIAFGAGATVRTVATVAFGTRAAIVAVVTVLAIGTGQVAETVLEFGGKAALLTNDGVANFAEDGLDLEEHVHQHAESGGLEN
jgi:hypothetical protein